MTYDELAGSVKLSEGFRDHIYMDTEGFATIGWGHKLLLMIILKMVKHIPKKSYKKYLIRI